MKDLETRILGAVVSWIVGKILNRIFPDATLKRWENRLRSFFSSLWLVIKMYVVLRLAVALVPSRAGRPLSREQTQLLGYMLVIAVAFMALLYLEQQRRQKVLADKK